MQTLQTWLWRQKQKSQNITSLLSSNFLIPDTRIHKTRRKEEGGVCFCVHMCIWEGSTEGRTTWIMMLVWANFNLRFFQWSCMDVRVGLWRKLSAEELMRLNCGVGEDSWESLGLQGDPISPFWRRSALGFLWREWCWSWNSSTLATSCKELTHWKRLWCWEGLGAGGEGDDWGWGGWMASLTRWTWVWVNSGIWWWTGRPGVLQFMGSQKFRHDWVTELNWTENKYIYNKKNKNNGKNKKTYMLPTEDSELFEQWNGSQTEPIILTS